MEKKMTLAEMEQRLEEIKNRIWWLDMADRLVGREREEWERLTDEKIRLIGQIRKLKEGK